MSLAVGARARRGRRAVSTETWRSDERYEALKGCSATDLAWEFLRRNPDYRADFAKALESASGGPACAGSAPWARWGLSFRGRSDARGRPPAHLLAA
jgi:hypothetical protein